MSSTSFSSVVMNVSFRLLLRFLFELYSIICLRSLRTVYTVSVNIRRARCKSEISSMEDLRSEGFCVQESSLESPERFFVFNSLLFSFSAGSRSFRRCSTVRKYRVQTFSVSSVGCLRGRFSVNGSGADRGVPAEGPTGLCLTSA